MDAVFRHLGVKALEIRQVVVHMSVGYVAEVEVAGAGVLVACEGVELGSAHGGASGNVFA